VTGKTYARLGSGCLSRRWDSQSIYLELSSVAFPMSTASSSSQSLLEELDTRQNEILDQLDELNARIERVLKECLPAKEPGLRIATE